MALPHSQRVRHAQPSKISDATETRSPNPGARPQLLRVAAIDKPRFVFLAAS